MGHKYYKCFWKVVDMYGASKLVEFTIKAQITIGLEITIALESHSARAFE